MHRLGRLYRSNRHVLMVGPAGVGKTRLMAELIRTHPVLFAPSCSCMGDLLAALEPAAGVKINRIENLSDDISLAIKAQSSRRRDCPQP